MASGSGGTRGEGSFPPFLNAVSLGLIPGYTAVVIAGHNPDIDATPEEDIWEGGGSLSYLSSAETMNIASTAAADDDGSTGVETILVKGLDASYLEIQEVVTMNGTSNVLTSNSYLRVHQLIAQTAGTGLTNAGIITATASSAATVQCEMDAGEGTSQNSHYTIPAGKSGIVLRVELDSHKTVGASPLVEFMGMVRPFGGAWIQVFGRHMETDVDDSIVVEQPVAPLISAKTDIRMAVSSDKADTEVRSRMYLLLKTL